MSTKSAGFKKATKKQAKLRFTFDGPAGSGKTFSSLLLAKSLGGSIALIDTEHGSASKYANLFDFDTLELQEFSLETYVKSIVSARGYDVLIIDSLSHAWNGKGGALETVDRLGGSNKFTNGWKQVTPLHNQLIDAVLSFPGHVIATMRTKMEYVIEKDERSGKSSPRKVGMAPVQREGMEYEFDVVADLSIEGSVTISKTRCPDLSGTAGMLKHADIAKMGETLKKWLSDGVAADPPPPLRSVPVSETSANTGSLKEKLAARVQTLRNDKAEFKTTIIDVEPGETLEQAEARQKKSAKKYKGRDIESLSLEELRAAQNELTLWARDNPKSPRLAEVQEKWEAIQAEVYEKTQGVLDDAEPPMPGDDSARPGENDL